MDEKTKLILIACSAGVFLLLIILAICWDKVEPTQYGIIYNSISKKVDPSHVYEGGRYLLFFTNSFVTFPKTVVTIEFSETSSNRVLKTRTKEGLALALQVSFQYKLIKDKLGDLYTTYNINYETIFIRIAREIILQEAGSYEAPDYWVNRTRIGESMRNSLNETLYEAGAECVSLQLLRIGLPETYENQIVLTQVEVQKRTMKTYEQAAAIIRADIEVDVSEYGRTIAGILSSANSRANLIKQNATAIAAKNVIDAESSAYEETREKLGFSQDEMMKYVYYTSIKSVGKATLLFGVNQGMININGAGRN